MSPWSIENSTAKKVFICLPGGGVAYDAALGPRPLRAEFPRGKTPVKLAVARKRPLGLEALKAAYLEGKMVRPERFELPTFWFVARRSIQLS
jgi:hypothetical protein